MALLSLGLTSCCTILQKTTDGIVRPLVAQPVEPFGVFRVVGLPPDQKVVALTIDDAPSPRTHELLNFLAERKATATFFVHGDRITPANRHLIRRMLAEGHEVANHMPESVTSAKLPPSVFERQFLRNHEILVALGAKPVRFRPSQGFGNKTMAAFMKSDPVRKLGYHPKFYLASNFCWDIGKHGLKPACYGRYTATSAVPGRITVFHDNQDVPDGKGGVIDQTARTLQGLPIYLDTLQAQGFSARSLAEVEELVAAPTP